MKTTFAHDMPKRALMPIIILVALELWKERNSRIFRSLANTLTSIMVKIKEEAYMWIMAGAKNLIELHTLCE